MSALRIAVGTRDIAVRLGVGGSRVASRRRAECQSVRMPGAWQVPAAANRHETKSKAQAGADRSDGYGGKMQPTAYDGDGGPRESSDSVELRP